MGTRRLAFLGVIVSVLFASFQAGAQDTLFPSFANRLILTETPQLGQPWHGGMRTGLFVTSKYFFSDWNIFWNVKDWVSIDLLLAGLPSLNGKDGTHVRDYFWTVSFKSRPFFGRQTAGRYEAAAGARLYYARFLFANSAKAADSVDQKDASLVAFLSQGGVLNRRHRVNLLASAALDFNGPGMLRINPDTSMQRSTSFYVVPGYDFLIGRGWHAGMEYFLTNSRYIPLGILQFAHLGMSIENSDQDWLSFIAWGVQFKGRHLYVGTHLIHHWSFQQPIILCVGVGGTF